METGTLKKETGDPKRHENLISGLSIFYERITTFNLIFDRISSESLSVFHIVVSLCFPLFLMHAKYIK